MPRDDQVRVPIDREIHRLLRIEAARRGMTIKEVIAWLVRKEIKE